MASENVTSAWAMPFVDPERAMLDSVAVLPQREADAMVDEHIRTSVNARKLQQMCDDDVGRKGVYCDFVDERSRTIVEIDGREFHSEPEVFRKDRPD